MSTPPNGSNNWGRWGPDDQRGMLNLVTPEKVADAAGLAKRGVVYNLAVPLGRGERIYPGFHETWRITTANTNQQTGVGVSGDVLAMHSHAGTHVDALSHFWRDGTLYNGRDASAINSREGVTWAGIDRVGSFVTRGILADIPRHRGVEYLTPEDGISGQDLVECLAAEGIEPREGDVLLLRTGWHQMFSRDRAMWDSGEPGFDESSAEWLSDQGIVAVGADSPGLEWIPSYPHSNPFHVRALRDFGIYIFENLDLEALGADRAYEFMFVAAPLPLVGGTGASCVPVAIA